MYLHQILTSIHNNNNIYHTWDTRRGRNEYQIQTNSKITKTTTTGTVTATTRTEDEDDDEITFIEGNADGRFVGKLGATDGILDGSIDGRTLGLIEGFVGDTDGVELGASVGGPEIHVARPEAEHAGYAQAAVSPTNGVVPKTIPPQFCMIAIFRALQ